MTTKEKVLTIEIISAIELTLKPAVEQSKKVIKAIEKSAEKLAHKLNRNTRKETKIRVKAKSKTRSGKLAVGV